ncbi:uncharacterized protein LOC124158715 [Ischnura elegans]|uniref:uncharacterized protein LOC124158715 n=1 Tax=Ischnura elegans TaxID=197161 RepID=UPI001ED8A13E|nr:uncharacterized protein LOC124158715 [Ischnura elegans]
MPWLALAVPLVAVTVLGLLLNGYILLVVLLTKQVHTANTLLLLHLGAVDVLLCALFLLFAAPGALGARGPADAASSWASTPPLCSLHSFLAALLHPLALWTVCGLNCDRCAAIAAPLHYARLVSTRRAAIFLLSTWVLCLAVALPSLFLPQASPAPPSPPTGYLSNVGNVTTEDPDWNFTATPQPCSPGPSSASHAPYILLLILGTCSSEWYTQGDQSPRIPPPPLSPWYPSAYTALTLLLPAGLILACNVKVLTIARYHRHRIAAAIFEVTLSAQVTITHQRNPFPLTKPRAPASGPGGWIGGGLFGNRRSALLTVVQLIGSLLLLYFPFYSVMMWHSFQGVAGGGPGDSGGVPPLLLTASSALLACSPPVNGFIYGVRSKVLRRTFANYWRKQMSKSAVNQEIQARTPSTCGSRRPSLTPLGLQRRASMDACLGFPALPPAPPSAASTSSSSSAGSSAGPRAGPPKPRITRVASELSWRPLGVASPIAGVAPVHLPRRTRSFRERRTTTTGLHTLQAMLPDEEGKEAESEAPCAVAPERRLSSSTTTLLERRLSREQTFSSGESPEDDSAAEALGTGGVRWRIGSDSAATDEISVSKENGREEQEDVEPAGDPDEAGEDKPAGSPRLYTSLDSILVSGGSNGAGEGGHVNQDGPNEDDASVPASVAGQGRPKVRGSTAPRKIRFGVGDQVHHSWPSRTRGGGGGVGANDRSLQA